MSLLHDVLAFCKTHDLPETTFGRGAVKDPRLVSDLRRGRQVRSATEQRIRAFMETWGEE